jgi:hypothetical protein
VDERDEVSIKQVAETIAQELNYKEKLTVRFLFNGIV